MWTAVLGGLFVALVLGGAIAAMFGFVLGTPAFGVTFVVTWFIAAALFWPKESVPVEPVPVEPVADSPATTGRGGFGFRRGFAVGAWVYLAAVLVAVAWQAIV